MRQALAEQTLEIGESATTHSILVEIIADRLRRAGFWAEC